jgi:hypothetical protein
LMSPVKVRPMQQSSKTWPDIEKILSSLQRSR